MHTRVPPLLLCLTIICVLGHAAPLPEPTLPKRKAWPSRAAKVVLDGAVGSIDLRYPQDTLPSIKEPGRNWAATAWRGDRAYGQPVIWTGTGLTNAKLFATDLQGPAGAIIPAEKVELFWMRYVLAGDKGPLLADVLEPNKPIDVPSGTTRPIWFRLNVPADAAPGIYNGTLTVTADGDHKLDFALQLEVLPATLPPVAEWSLLVNVFQSPWHVAERGGYELWSDAHFAELQKLVDLAADMGCKVVTGTPEKLITPTRKKDGSWDHDFTVFDRYVQMAMDAGLDRQIQCNVPLPRKSTRTVEFFDEATGARGKIAAGDAKAYFHFWEGMLRALHGHLKSKGWLERSTVYFDEPKGGTVLKYMDLANQIDPNWKLAVAASRGESEKYMDRTYDFSFIIGRSVNPERNRIRRVEGRQTSFYVCAYPGEPNNFTWSKPGQSAWMGWYAASQDYTGFLRWAICWWIGDDDPLVNTLAGGVPAGDCWLVYPGMRGSLRFLHVPCLLKCTVFHYLQHHSFPVSPLPSFPEC